MRSLFFRSRLFYLFCLALVVGGPLPAVLSDEDNVPPAGFTVLFNGRNLEGWKGLVANPPKRRAMSAEELASAQRTADERIREHWKAVGGVLVFDGKGHSLVSARDYGDFELFVDWKILPEGDSGIYVRGSPQIQIWAHTDGSGGLFNNRKHPSTPLVRADRPVGEWNRFRIIMIGERVTVYLNGVLVVDSVVLENYWERGEPIYARGPIELQNHGNSLFFKNIFVRELSGDEAAAVAVEQLAKGDHVAVVGDSITEQKLYSRYLEDYLVACQSQLDLRVMQLGWSGERAPGFEARLANDLLPFAPDVVTTCYGMNDGRYRAYEPSIGATYQRSMENSVRRLRQAGIKVVVGSPGAVDTYSFKRHGLAPAVYNDNLARLRDIARGVAQRNGAAFANVHDAMVVAMLKAKAALGEAYDVCGADGFHPRPNGHIVMAYAFLKAMGVDGHIGTIEIDMQGGTTVTAGHRVLSSAKGAVEVESTRYPFCFYGDDKSPASTRSIVPFVPFQQDLNRFALKVKNLDAKTARVRWGEHSKEFTRKQLEQGINLAAEFLQNPFSAPFRALDQAVAEKQSFETRMIKGAVTHFRRVRPLLEDDARAMSSLDSLVERFVAKERNLQEKIRAAVRPVRHTIRVEELTNG